MSPLRVLITNNALCCRAGTELYVRDLATHLLARGHEPVVFSTHLGDVARLLRRAGVPVVDDLSRLAAPDVIHGHHHLDTMVALLRFPGVPAVHFCHGWLPWEETPVRFPRILRHVAIDRGTRDRLVTEHGIPEDLVRVIPNFVDMDRFRPRGPLPPRPRRALLFNNDAAEGSPLVAAVREACGRAAVGLDVRGLGSGNPSGRPEELLADYDLVFATGRSALEALAVGAAVVLCHVVGAGPLVTGANYPRLRAHNFGLRELRFPVQAGHLLDQIAAYDPDDAARVSALVRGTAGCDTAVDGLLRLYREVIAESARDAADAAGSERVAAADYLRGLMARLKDEHQLRAESSRLRGELAAARQAGRDAGDRARGLQHRFDRLTTDHGRLTAERNRVDADCRRLAAERDRLAAELAAVRETRTLRMRDWLLRLPLVRRLARIPVRPAGRPARDAA